MKKLFFFVYLLLIAVSLSAQPKLMNYQGVARGRNGQVVGNQNITLQIQIIAGEAFGSPVYTEVHKITTSQFGVFNIHIGAGNPIQGNFTDVEWSLGNHYVKVEMDVKGGNNFKDLGTTQLLSVPYAFHSQTAGSVLEAEPGQLKRAKPGVKSQTWSMFGNRETNPETDRLGTTDETDLVFITNNEEALRILSNGNIKITNSLDIGGNLRVRGDSVIIDHDLFVGDTTHTRSLYVKDDVADEGEGGFVATFENSNDGNGDGINIKLGKLSANNGLQDINLDLGMSPGQVEAMKNLIGCDLSPEAKIEILQELVIEGVRADALMYGGMTVEVGNLLIDFINDKLVLPRVEVFPTWGWSYDFPLSIGRVGFTIPAQYLGPIDLPDIPEVDLSLLGIDEIEFMELDFWGIPDICLDDEVSNPLNNENEFIRFSDFEDKKMGAIRAESVDDWASNYLSPLYLWGLRGALTSALDKNHGRYHFKNKITEAVMAYAKIGVEYSSGNGDYAEWLERLDAKEKISAGDIVSVRSGKITKDLSNAEQVMAVSHFPIVLGNVPEDGKLHLGNNIAFMGQIPVKVMGPVSSGDYIVGKGNISGYGLAVRPEEMTVEDFRYAVGRSWDTNPDKGPKMVNTVVGVHNGDYLNILKQYEKRFKSSEDRLQALESKIEILTGTTAASK